MSVIKVTDGGGQSMTLVGIDGCPTCTFHRKAEDQVRIIQNAACFPCREDDIFILAPVKSGTHWTWEILSMLINRKAETIQRRKVNNMIEHVEPSTLEAIPSPRILNSHLPIRHLPAEMFTKKCKVIRVLRNPKDMLVSWYHHVTGIRSYGYSGKWEHFLDLFYKDQLEYGSWFERIQEWENLILERPDLPILTVYYEDLQKDIFGEIKRLALFLDVHVDDQLVQDIADQCAFHKMRVNKTVPDIVKREIYNGEFTIFRKGTVGDWKNWFTVAQSERFDEIYKERLKSCTTMFPFII